MQSRLMVSVGLPLILLAAPTLPRRSFPQTVVTPQLSLVDPTAQDQDDMCIWIHPSDRSLSAIVASDKAAGRLFVYDLDGATLQAVVMAGGEPGNIDVRYGFPMQGQSIDLVGVNDRSSGKLCFYSMDAQTRTLARIDNDSIWTAAANYGISLYVSPTTGKFYVFSSTRHGVIEQFELRGTTGRVGATLVRTWDLGGITEGSVCDDENGVVFFGEEDVGIWRFGAEPEDPTVGVAVAAVGDASGVVADVEGLTLYYAADGEGYLIASSQGNSSFRVYGRKPPHIYIGSFVVAGTIFTDGIDVTNVDLGPAFPNGIFVLHNDRTTPRPVEVCAYEDLGLVVDTEYWDPRRGSTVSIEILPAWVDAVPGRTRIVWQGARAGGRPVVIHRRTEVSVWSPVGAGVVDAAGQLAFEDANVRGGVRYGYRIGLMERGIESFHGEVWVDSPPGHRLACEGFRPNPAVRDVRIALSLSDTRPARLEIFDLTGRRRHVRRMKSPAPGKRVVNLGSLPGLSSGVYLVRVTQGDARVSRRALLLR